MFVALLVLAACQTATPAPVGPKPVPTAGPMDLPGSLVFPSGNKLFALEIASMERRVLAEFPVGTILGAPTVSRDGAQIVFTVYKAPTDPKQIGGSDLYVVPVAGGSPTLLLEHDGEGASLAEPIWSPDGQRVYFTNRAVHTSTDATVEESQIERINRDGSGREVIVQDATSPSLSADGQLLSYIVPANGQEATSLWVASADGQQPRQLVGPEFTEIAAPRFAPGGSQIVFSAVGGPTNAPKQAQRPTIAPLTALLLPGRAEAHGIPWDLWLVAPDGSGLAQLTDVGEDGPVATWSPDGSWIAIAGEMGIYLVDVQSQSIVMLAPEYTGSLAWIPE